MSDLITTTLSGSLDKALATAPQAASPAVHGGDLERLDLSKAINDESLSIHQLACMQIHAGETVAQVRVFDLEHVFAHPTAKLAIKRAYISPLFLIEAFAQNYRDHLLRKLTRGNDKGLFVLDPAASTYVHRLRDGTDLVVQAETVEVGGTYTRRLTITRRDQVVEGCVQ
ncbi:MAG TPA: hypothetical protein PK347_02760 [Burkholderiaceae bacterium]|nr:hypothetical protein [Burkholderiaceae bacterium]